MIRSLFRTVAIALSLGFVVWWFVSSSAKTGGEPDAVRATVTALAPLNPKPVTDCFDGVCRKRERDPRTDSYRAVVTYESGRKCAFTFAPEVAADRGILAGLRVGDPVLVDALRCHVQDWSL